MGRRKQRGEEMSSILKESESRLTKMLTIKLNHDDGNNESILMHS